MTAIASASFVIPRTPGRRSEARPPRSGLRPDATLISPSRARTAAAQWVGPWTSSPLRSAMPPSRSLFSGVGEVTLAEYRLGPASPDEHERPVPPDPAGASARQGLVP